jgi:hypothetical protein
MKAVELHAGVEAIGQRLNDLLAHKRLSPVCSNGKKHGNGRQECKNDSTRPEWPAGYASA